MSRIFNIILATTLTWLAAACMAAKPPVVTPPTPPAPVVRTILVIVGDQNGIYVPGAFVTLQDVPTNETGTTGANGQVQWNTVTAATQSTNLSITVTGCDSYVQPLTLTAGANQQIAVGAVAAVPAAIRLPSLNCPPPWPPAQFFSSFLPFDADDPGGVVHTTLPPEQMVPTHPDINWWRGDFAGVTTPLTPPFVPGANTTPANMWMSFQLPSYPAQWQDYYLGEYVKRGYTHILLQRPPDLSPASISAFVALCKHIQNDYHLFVVYWASGSADPPNQTWSTIGPQIFIPPLQALIQAKAVDIVIVGEELNSWNIPGPTGLDTIINGVCALTNPAGIPTYLHFTSNVPAWYDATTGDPIAWWKQFDGTKPGYGKLAGLCWQSNAYDPAGAMGAHLWDARKYLAQASLSFLVVAFETRATENLYGQSDETNNRRTGWELICTTRDQPAPQAPPVAGFMNGGSRPDGGVL